MDELTALIDSLKASEQKEEGIVTRDVMDMAQCGERKARRIIHKLTLAGKLKPAWIYRVSPWGIRQKIKGYLIVDDAKGAEDDVD